MNISEQHSLHNIDVDSLRSIVGTHLGSTLLDSEASDSSLHLPLIAPEVVKLSGIRPNDDSQEQVYNDDGIGISQREEHHYGGSRRQPLDLHALWRLLEHMDKEARRNGLIGSGHGRKNIGLSNINGEHIPSTDDIGTQTSDDDFVDHGKMSTWELVVLQAVLLTLLIFISLLWAFCCKKKCLSDQPLMTEMVALARKISSGSSKDLPPSYSKVDLTQEGLTLEDHFNPPPNYDRASDMYHLEMERKRIEAEGQDGSSNGRRTPAPDYTPTLSFHHNRFRRIDSSASVSSLSRISISSNIGNSGPENISNDTNPNTCVVSIESSSGSFNQTDLPLNQPRKKSSVMSTSSTHSSNSSSSRKTSRVTFSPILEEGPTNRKVSSQSVPCRSVLISKTNEASRKRSAVSEGSAGSRKVSFVFEDAHSSNGVVSKTSRVDPSPDLEKALQVQLELARQAGEMDDFISSSNNLNNEGVKSSPPMI